MSAGNYPLFGMAAIALGDPYLPVVDAYSVEIVKCGPRAERSDELAVGCEFCYVVKTENPKEKGVAVYSAVPYGGEVIVARAPPDRVQ